MLSISEDVSASEDVESLCGRTFLGGDGVAIICRFMGVDVNENRSGRVAYSLLHIDLRCVVLNDVDDEGGRY